MADSLTGFMQTFLNKAHSLGADAAEFYLLRSKDMDIQIKNAKVEETKLAENQGIGVRVIKNNRLGFSFSADFTQQSLDKMLHQAITNAAYNDPDPYLALPTMTAVYPKLAIYDETITKHSLEEKIALAVTAEQTAKTYDKRIERVERSGYEDGETEIWIANSNGLYGYQKGGYCGIYCMALASDGASSQSGYGMDINIYYDKLSAQKAGEMAAKRAAQLLGAGTIATQTADLVLDPQIAVQIMGIISAGFSGEAVLKGRSLFNHKHNQPIASSLVTIVDDGLLEGGLGTMPFDGEGVATQTTLLVENGVLKNYLYNTRSANEAGTLSTGNGLRGSFKGTPSIGTTNYYVKAGVETVQSLINRVEKGLYVTEILGAHTANTISGDFSFGASGIWIEKGRFQKPVRGLTIAGNFKDLLQKIDGVANDLTFFGANGAPTIKIAQIMIGGE